MPDFGSPVAQNVNAGNGLKTVSDLMGLQQQKQQIQSGAIGIQQQQQNLEKGDAQTQMTKQDAQQRAAIAKVDWSKYDDGTGTVSTDKMLGDSELRKAAGDQFLDVIKHGAAVRGMQMQNKQALVNLNDGLRSQFGSVVGALRTDPDVIADNPMGRQKVTAAMDQYAQAGGPDAANIAKIYGPIVDHAPKGKLVRGISAIQLQALDASRQAGAQAPSFTDTGSGLQQTNPQAAGGDLGAPPAQKQLGGAPGLYKGLPPTTGVMRGGVPGYLGDPNVQAGPALGEAAGVAGPVEAHNAHFAQVTADAAGAPNRIAALQTIKQEAPNAVTGGGDYRRKFVSQISGLFGIANDAQTSTDVMAKNLAVLAAQGGNTDASRTLGEMANPSFHMTKEAAQKTADQLIGIEGKKAAAQRFFSGTPTNSPGYEQKLNDWNTHADPRAFEYAAKSPADQATMKAELKKADTWQSLQKHMHQLDVMGVHP